MNEIDAFRKTNFDWTMHLKSVWSDPTHDVCELHHALRAECAEKLEQLQTDGQTLSPLGWVLAGSGGTGKTHLLSILRHEALQRRTGFVLVDMTDVHDFWGTVLLGYLNSLQQPYAGDQFQHEVLMKHFIEFLNPTVSLEKAVRKLRACSIEQLATNMANVLRALNRRYPRETGLYQDVIRALISLNSEDFDISGVGQTWLQGHEVDEEHQKALGFKVSKKRPIEIVEALSWLMSLVGPTVLAFDQLDPIVSQLNITSDVEITDDTREEIRVAQKIIEDLSAGLAALHNITHRTFTVVSCLESTWNNLTEKVMLKTNLDRFEPLRRLNTIQDGAIAERIVRARVEPVYRNIGFSAPYPTWPFAAEAFGRVQGLSPRQILQICDRHQRECLRDGQVKTLRDFSAEGNGQKPPEIPQDVLGLLDQKFSQLRDTADPKHLLEEKMDDERLAPLLQSACACVVRENPTREDIDAVVDVDFHGGKTTRALHARLKLTYHAEGDREEHFCLRAIERRIAVSFQARLKAAMTLSGIDRSLKFRRLVIVRQGKLPRGPKTLLLIETFQKAGGIFIQPTDDELRTLWALQQLADQGDPDFYAWLLDRRPASNLPLMQQAVPVLCQNGKSADDPADVKFELPKPQEAGGAKADIQPSPPPVPIPPATETVPEATRSAPQPPTPDLKSRRVLLGRRIVGKKIGNDLTLDAAGLEKHTLILAGSGSGKTVLLRRLIEETAVLGIPSIVVDCANDLATLGDAWPKPHESWQPGDRDKQKRFHACTETVVWTPGRESGNPLNLEPLPDFAAVVDDKEEFASAVEMARDALSQIVASGNSAVANHKKGILTSALGFFGRSGGDSLDDFIELLRELPSEAQMGIDKEEKLARAMADSLRVEMVNNPLLGSSGTGLDPAVLFGDSPASKKTRISVISAIGLQSLNARRQFLNQLSMTLFSWIKKNPSPPGGRPLRGLLVIDEAKDYVPSQAASVCKASVMRLAAQARKYHLGVVFATQNPREIDNTIISNCSTHYYGKMNSPTAIDTIRDLIAGKGGSGGDVGTLSAGRFYVYNADAGMQTPVKVAVPMCLSHHRDNPLTESEVIERAKASRP